MLSERVQNGIYDQINLEFSSSYAYLSMAAFCEWKKFIGCSKWLRMQAQEENTHALRLYDYLLARDCQVKLKAIEAPPVNYESVPAVFAAALAHEQKVTASINDLYKLAYEEGTFATMIELEWFINEQVEEEKTARQIVAQFEMVKDDPAALLDLDRELGSRKSEEDEAEG
ncbi:MAG: ferritin [Planctomycetota bacterium]